MKKIVYKISCFFVICIVLFLNIYFGIDYSKNTDEMYNNSNLKKETIVFSEGDGEKQLELYSKSAVLIDADNNRILYNKNAGKGMPMASTTKIMTCICALENGNLDDYVTISGNASAQPKVKLGVARGEQYKLKDLLYALMLESYNDAAVAIAEHISGSVEQFAKIMNQKAIDLNCNNTYFVTPNGLDGKVTLENGITISHHTTAFELAKIMNYCINTSEKKEEFLNITRAASHAFSEKSGKRNFSVSNHNAALTSIDGCISGKTGFTNEAGYCYIGAFNVNEHQYILALLACGWPNNKGYKWKDCRTLIDYAKNNYKMETKNVGEMNYKSREITVYNSGCFKDESCKITTTVKGFDDFNILLGDEREEINIFLPNQLEAPVDSSIPVGYMTYRVNNDNVRLYNIYADKNVKKNYLEDYFYQIWKILLMGK